MIDSKIYFIILAFLLFLSCNNGEIVNVKLCENKTIKEILFRNNNKNISYSLKLDEKGNLSNIEISNNDTTLYNFSLFENGGLKKFSKTVNKKYTNSAVELDSISNISRVDITNFIKDDIYLNQFIVFNPNGIISSQKSLFLTIEEELLKDNKALLQFKLHGIKSKYSYAVIGNFDKNYNPIEPVKLDTFVSLNNTINAYISVKKGLNIIKGQVVGKEKNKLGEGNIVYFSKEIYIK